MSARLATALRDAVIATAVAFGLFVAMVGLRTDVAPNGALFLRQRWGDVALLCGLVFVGRLLVTLWGLRPHSLGQSPRRAAMAARLGMVFAPALLALALVLPFIPGVARYELDLAILVLTYVMLGWGLNIVVGLAGLLDLGYVAFYRRSGSSTRKIGQKGDARRRRERWRSRTLARHAVQWRRWGRISSTWALVAAPSASACTIGLNRSHSSPASISSYARMNRRRPSVIARLTLV
jgi:hypothetical protein